MIRPSSRYSSSSESSPSLYNYNNNNNNNKKHTTTSTARRNPSHPISATAMQDTTSRAIVRTRSGDVVPTKNKNKNNNNAHASTFGTMVKKFMEKKMSNLKPGSADRVALPVPTTEIFAAAAAAAAAGDSKSKKQGSNLTTLHRKLFQIQKGGNGGSSSSSSSSADRSNLKALTEVKANTRTLAMVLRSERELLTLTKEYEEDIQQLRLLVEEKNREVDKLKDLCLKQREEIKALKDAILFPDVMNSQLHDLFEKQGSELKQARQIIPSLQKQVSSLTGQLQGLADDLAEVKADKYTVRTCFDGHISSPQTPKSDQEAQNSLECSSGCPMTYGSPDEMFLKDLNPCLTPCFAKTRTKEYNQMLGYDSPSMDASFQNSAEFSPDDFSSSRDGILSKSSEHCQRPTHRISTARKVYKSDESKWSVGKPRHQSPF